MGDASCFLINLRPGTLRVWRSEAAAQSDRCGPVRMRPAETRSTARLAQFIFDLAITWYAVRQRRSVIVVVFGRSLTMHKDAPLFPATQLNGNTVVIARFTK